MRNLAERAIQTLKDHLIAGLCSCDPKFPLHLWDKLIPQGLITLNLLRPSHTCPQLSAYAQIHGAFDYNQTPLAPPPPVELTALPPIDTDGTATPYADPAYAEANPTMAGVRIGGKGEPKFNLPKLTGRNLRVAALVTGVAVVGLVAAKGVFSSNDGPTALPQLTAEQQNNVAPISIPKPAQTLL